MFPSGKSARARHEWRRLLLRLLSVLQLLPPPGLASRAGAEQPAALSPAEQAVLDVFLRRRPRYRHSDTPGTLATKGPGELGWADGLTAESFARIAAVHPDLQRRVDEGRQFRVDYFTGVLRRV